MNVDHDSCATPTSQHRNVKISMLKPKFKKAFGYAKQKTQVHHSWSSLAAVRPTRVDE